ncbi:MAG: hypothetical protein ABEJ31_06745 [Haloarculaceae archaeon]
MHDRITQRIEDEDRRNFLRILGLTGAATAAGGVADEFTLSDVRDAVEVSGSAALAEMGRAIRNDLSGTPDAELIGSGLSGLAAGVGDLADLRDRGSTESQGTAFQDLAQPGWDVANHLSEIGFFAAAEQNLPPFTADHIASTTREFVHAESLAAVLADMGFSAEDRTALAVDVVNNNEHLSHWAPTRTLAEHGVEDVVVEDVAPLHQRAVAGALLWIDGLDRHVWQNGVLLTDEMFADGMWDVKQMLGGVALVGHAARGIARGDVTDEQLTALITTGSAAAIDAQTALKDDMVHITDDMRAPRGAN